MDWNDWLRNDKTALGLLLIFFAFLWAWTRDDKVMDLMITFQGALIAIVTGAVIRRGNGNGNGETK